MPLSVGILAPPWLPVPPLAYGGTENVIDTLAQGLKAAGHTVRLFTTGDATCPVHRAWTFQRSLGIGRGGVAAEARQVAEGYAAMEGVDIVHDHTIVGPLYAAGVYRHAVTTTNHGPFDCDMAPIYRAIAARIPLIAISEHQRSTARGIPVARVIHHGIDVRRVPLGAGRGEYAVFLGRMDPTKGVDAAIAASRAAGIPLRIAAKMQSREEREYFASVIEPTLGGDVEFLGEVTQHQKLELLGDATCLLNPIRWAEPFGMVMIESLACGTPVITTPYGSAPEIVEDSVTGVLCNDHGSLVRALQNIGDLDRRRCRAAVKERFSAGRMVADHVAFYRSVIAGWDRQRVTADRGQPRPRQPSLAGHFAVSN